MFDDDLRCFADSVTYTIEKAAIYLRLKGAQLFSKFDLGITLEQYIALDTLYTHKGICQRDLCKLILKDRSNTGRILTILEDKGLLKRTIETKKNRLIKKILLTDKGEKLIRENRPSIKEDYMKEVKKFTQEELDSVKIILEKLILMLGENTTIQI